MLFLRFLLLVVSVGFAAIGAGGCALRCVPGVRAGPDFAAAGKRKIHSVEPVSHSCRRRGRERPGAGGGQCPSAKR